MKLLPTSSGMENPSIRDALVDLLGKPIAESSALIVRLGAIKRRLGQPRCRTQPRMDGCGALSTPT